MKKVLMAFLMALGMIVVVGAIVLQFNTSEMQDVVWDLEDRDLEKIVMLTFMNNHYFEIPITTEVDENGTLVVSILKDELNAKWEELERDEKFNEANNEAQGVGFPAQVQSKKTPEQELTKICFSVVQANADKWINVRFK